MFNIVDNIQENIKVSDKLLKYSKKLFDELLSISDAVPSDLIRPEFSKVLNHTEPDTEGKYITRQYFYYYSKDTHSEVRLSINENETFDISISSTFGPTYFSFDYFGMSDFSKLNTFITSYFINNEKRTYNIYPESNWKSVFSWIDNLRDISTSNEKVKSETYLNVIERFEKIGLVTTKDVRVENAIIELIWDEQNSVLIGNNNVSIFLDGIGPDDGSGYYMHFSYHDLDNIYIPEEFVQLINESVS